MTNLLKELEAVVAIVKSDENSGEYVDAICGDLIRTHHAEIAEAVRCRRAIISQCMVTEAVTPDLDRPYETISRVIDYYIAMHNSAREGGGMKLRTKMIDGVLMAYDRSIDPYAVSVMQAEYLKEDAACAHALMLAIEEIGGPKCYWLDCASSKEVREWIRDRSNDLLEFWGFNSTPEQPE